ncbi:MAG: acylphosphatase [Gammaproteobacteria bacterium]|nr:acylphosphatase [Gammaproteobacteria bacterium]
METKETTICVRCLISGKVQGVFFRASARHQAELMGLSCRASNLHDGRVEVLACGNPKDIGKLKAWLTKGPPQARVSGVACEVMEQTNL